MAWERAVSSHAFELDGICSLLGHDVEWNLAMLSSRWALKYPNPSVPDASDCTRYTDLGEWMRDEGLMIGYDSVDEEPVSQLESMAIHQSVSSRRGTFDAPGVPIPWWQYFHHCDKRNRPD